MAETKTIFVKVTPKASSNRIKEIQLTLTGEEQVKVYVTAAPEDGKANKAVMKLLSEHYGTAISNIRIVKGLKSREKIIEVTKNAH